jgi:hypothetical protein
MNLNAWTTRNIKGYRVFFTDGTSTSIQGPDLMPDEIRSSPPYHYHTIDRIEEYTYADTIRWAIASHRRQLETTQTEIARLETELATVK